MFERKEKAPPTGADLESDLLSELESQCIEQIHAQRAFARMDAKIKVILRPGNASERRALKVQGLTGDISAGGCRAVFPVPVGVGDLFQLEFDQEVVSLPLVFARCLRCRLLRDDAFEVGFSFFNPIDLPGRLARGKD